jgi:ribulose-bisphosphate carboxylase large chain
MPRKRDYSSCEVSPVTGGKSDNRNRLYAFKKDFTWQGVKLQEYKEGGADWSEMARQVLIGARGESAGFHLRYFEIMPGGFSSFETHKHEHVVICIRGKGQARVNRRNIDLKYLDVLYINPETAHRLSNPFQEPFGFFCIVNARRDRPRPVNMKNVK